MSNGSFDASSASIVGGTALVWRIISARAVVFDLDGVLVDSETVWDAARRALVDEAGGHWTEHATTDMIGMSSIEWSQYLHDELAVGIAPDEISSRVADRVTRTYENELPLLPGARRVVRELASRLPLGLASSSNRSVIEVFLDHSELRACFTATTSSEEVPHGKPAPDVYLATLDRLAVEPADALAVEDSTNGIRSARAAGMVVVAIPNPHFPPAPETLATAARVLGRLDDLAELVTPSQ
jgi:HAD superfamily hydrolase (TIGR01509 family)